MQESIIVVLSVLEESYLELHGSLFISRFIQGGCNKWKA